MNKVKITFKGYFYGQDTNIFPNEAGIYCVYSTKQTAVKKHVIDKLVYIGKSNDIKRRIQEHTNSDFPLHMNYGYSYAVTSDFLDEIEAALIYTCKPSENMQNKNEYNYDSIFIEIDGKHDGISDTVIAKRK